LDSTPYAYHRGDAGCPRSAGDGQLIRYDHFWREAVAHRKRRSK
jgi:hypothetical protein